MLQKNTEGTELTTEQQIGYLEAEVSGLDSGSYKMTLSGKGYADFLFYPKVKSLPGIVIELKADGTPQAAIRQIKEKEYCEKLKREHPGKILLVGISYHTKKKEHQCRIEEYECSTGLSH